MTEFTASEKILAESTLCIMLLRGRNSQDEALYAYIAVSVDRLDAFMAAQDRSDFSPEEYGTILASGTGEPSPEVQDAMERDYGFTHDNMAYLRKSND